MTDQHTPEEGIEFVALHFREDTLLPRTGWQQFRKSHTLTSFRRPFVAACIGSMVLVASAAFYYFYDSTPAPTIEPEVPTSPSETLAEPKEKTVRIEFHDATLREVIDEIERVYDVKISHVPKEEMRITISYEGTASNAVETINELLDINLTVNPKTDLSSRQ